MKREVEMYVDIFKEKSGKISCNVLYQGKCYLVRNKSLNKYVDEIIKLKDNTLCDSDDKIKIYVDVRGIGYAVYDMLKDKYENTCKLNYEKHNNKPLILNDISNTIHITENGIDMGSGWTTKNVSPVNCENIKINNGSVSEKDVEKIIDKKLKNQTDDFVKQFEQYVSMHK
jgi:hypothetical protein